MSVSLQCCGPCVSYDVNAAGQGNRYGRCKKHRFLVGEYQGSVCTEYKEKPVHNHKAPKK